MPLNPRLRAALRRSATARPSCSLSRVRPRDMTANAPERKVRALDLFAGVGGSTLGATRAGVLVVAAVDSWKLARDTYLDNFPDVVFLRSKCEGLKLAA